MRAVIFVPILLISLAVILSGCGGAAEPTPIPASSEVQISLTTLPDPPKSGPVELVVQVNDANNQPIPEADVFVFADHIDMKGMSMNGRATAQGGGRYAINADMSMAGNWKVTVQVKKAPLDVVQEFNLELR